jgi:hypothetical protein
VRRATTESKRVTDEILACLSESEHATVGGLLSRALLAGASERAPGLLARAGRYETAAWCVSLGGCASAASAVPSSR